MDAGAIVGLLADDDRRRCYAALELGATTQDGVVASSGLSVPQVAKAVARLVAGGLVTAGPDGGLHPVPDVFATAARSVEPSGEH